MNIFWARPIWRRNNHSPNVTSMSRRYRSTISQKNFNKKIMGSRITVKIFLRSMETQTRKSDGGDSADIKVSTKRWFILALFMLYTGTVASAWMQFASITNIVARYYGVPRALVEWTSIMNMTARAFLLVPFLFLIDKLGTKKTLILGSILYAIGSCIKTFSVAPDRFYLAMTGQVFTALSLVSTYSLIGRVSAAWFSADEISRAGGFSSVGEIVGCGLSFLMPSRFVPDSENFEEIGRGMQLMHCYVSGFSIVTVILIIIFFKSKPKRPPSAAQLHFRSNKRQRVHKSVKKLVTNSNFVLFVITQGLFVGCGSNAVNTLLNEMLDTNFPGYTSHAGPIGCLNLFCGIFGSVVLSFIQDRTRNFKCMAVFLSAANCLGLSIFFISLKMGNIIYPYITFAIVGFLMQGYYATTIQMGIELAFPVPEGITVAATSVCVEIVSMTATSIYGISMRSFGDWKTNICTVGALFLSTIAVCMVPPEFKREKLERAAETVEGTKGLLHDSENKAKSATLETAICE